jgi:predicted nuclease of predicted toxin-antitoxin system
VNVLVDECLDWRLARELPGHNVKTVQDMGWGGTMNGRLLALAQGQFEVFITVDGNLSFQQNLQELSIAIIILDAESVRLVHLNPLMAKVRAILSTLNKGQMVKVGTG